MDWSEADTFCVARPRAVMRLDRQRKRVDLFLVESDEVRASKLTEMLESFEEVGFRVHRFVDLDAVAAMAGRLETVPSSLILLSIYGGGPEVFDTIRQAQEIGKRAAILILGEDDSLETKRKSLEMGVQDYFSWEQLDEAILERALVFALEHKQNAMSYEASHRLLEITSSAVDVQDLAQQFLVLLKELVGGDALAIQINLQNKAEVSFRLGQIPLVLNNSQSCPFTHAVMENSSFESHYFSDKGAFICNDIKLLMNEVDPNLAQQIFFAHIPCRSVIVMALRLGDHHLGVIYLGYHQPNQIYSFWVKHLYRLIGLLAVSIERLSAQQALTESEDIHRTLVESSPDGILLASLDFRIRKANAGAASLFETSTPEALVGRKLTDFVAKSELAAIEGDFQTVARSGEVLYSERAFQAEAKAFVAEVGISLSGPRAESPHYYVVILRDVSSRKKMQEQLAQSDRMATVGALAAGVAHEVNNPLTYILYNLTSLVEDLPPLIEAANLCREALRGENADDIEALLQKTEILDDEELLEDLIERVEEAAEGAEKVQKIVRSLKTFALKQDEHKSYSTLDGAMEAAIEMAYNQIKYRARITRDYQATPPLFMIEGRIRQVFLNFLLNAAQAIEEGAVHENTVAVKTWIEDSFVCASVSDTGVGISVENISRLFEPFFTTKPVGVGSGLGLSISHNIIVAHGGRIEVESHEGQGATFTVRLPRPKGTSTSMQAQLKKDETSSSGAKRILVIDDEPMVCSTIRRVFSREHEVVVANSGKQGRSVLQEDQGFDAIFCDIMMPDFSGIDIYDWLVQSSPKVADRMIFITGGAFTSRAISFLARVPNPQCEKPFDIETLKKQVQAVSHRLGDVSAS